MVVGSKIFTFVSTHVKYEKIILEIIFYNLTNCCVTVLAVSVMQEALGLLWLMRTRCHWTSSWIVLLLTNCKEDFMPLGWPLQVYVSKESNATGNDSRESRKEMGRVSGHRKWRRRKGEWQKRKLVLSLPGENWSSVRLLCQIDHCLVPLCLSFSLSCYSFQTQPHTHTHRTTHPDGYWYWLPKVPLNFHLAIRLVCMPAPLVHSHKPQEALLAGGSMAHNPKRSERWTACGCSGSLFFLPPAGFLHLFIKICAELFIKY